MMKHSINHYSRTVALAAVLLLTAATAVAHVVHELQMRVVINKLGNARVVEVRNCTMGENGTEGFIKQYNLHGMEVGELAVTDETGVPYEVDTPWDTDRSRRAKTGRCGICEGSDGPELCWGIGASGQRTYNIHYTLTRLVDSFDDSDGFIFKFYEPAPGAYARQASITIEPDSGAFTPENTRVWAFRFHGQVHIVDGKIVAQTSQPFGNESEGLVIMAQFNKGLFHPVTTRKGTFLDKVKKEAFKGSDYTLTDDGASGKASLAGNGYDPGSSNFWAEMWEPISALLVTVLWLVLVVVFIYQLFAVGGEVKTAHQNQRLFGNKQGKMTQWSREIPFGGDLCKTSQVLHANSPTDVNNKDQIAALVMRMTHLGLISLRQKEGLSGKGAGEFLITPPMSVKPPAGDQQAELMELVHKQMWKAAGADHVLQPKEMKAYMKQTPVEHRQVVTRISQLLSATGRSRGSLKADEVLQVYGLKKYLEEFTLLEERHVLDVGLWKEYMVFATLYGIARQVYADLKMIWPDYTVLAPQEALLMDTEAYTEVATYTMSGMAYVRSYETPEERQERLAREASESRSSGGGGSSSYGGGGGYSGGGGSGFR